MYVYKELAKSHFDQYTMLLLLHVDIPKNMKNHLFNYREK